MIKNMHIFLTVVLAEVTGKTQKCIRYGKILTFIVVF